MDSVYDHALKEIGNEGKYQKRFDVIYNASFMILWCMAYTNLLLTLVVTPHMCKYPEKPQNISEEEWKVLNIPRLDDIKGQGSKFDSCSLFANPYENNETKACQEYTYDNTWYDTTVPSEYNWVCDKEINVANILAYSKIAEIIGSTIFGWYGDKYGRRYTYIISVAMLLAGRMISLIAGNSYILFLIGCCIAQLPSWSAPQTLSVISIEMSSARRRSTITCVRFTAFGVGLFLLGMLYWWLRSWKIFLIVTTVPLVPYLIMSWKMIESPRWLYTQGRIQDSLAQLKKIAKVNGKPMKIDTEKNMLSSTLNDKPQVFGMFMLFSGWRLSVNTVLLMTLWLLTSLSYGYLLLSSGEKTDSNPFLDFSWQALTEVPAIYLSAWLSDSIGRRYTGITSLSLLGLAWIMIAFRAHSSSEWIRKWWIGTILSIVARLLTNITFFVVNLFNLELYPTSLRQTGLSFGNIFCGAAIAICPYILYLGRRFDSQLPGIILTIASLFGVGCTYFLPETLNAKLPESIEEAQTFGKKDKKSNQVQLKPLTA